MLSIGLTGGIGSGKSAVSRLLAERGAVIVDADVLAREVVAPGSPGLAAVVAEFGVGVLAPDGSLDRPALATLVFDDPTARARLNAIVHPLVGARALELAAEAAAADPQAVVVHDVPLLVENGLAEAYDLVLVVEAPERLRLERLAARGMAEPDVRARMAAQADDAARRALADAVIVNAGTLDELAVAVDEMWASTVAPRL